LNPAHLEQTRHGFVSLLPIWPGVVSIGLVYAVVSPTVGLSNGNILLLCVFVYSGAAQFAITSMLGTGATAWTIISTVALLNLRNILYGMSARRWLPRDSPPRPVLAHCLVDESYGLAEREAAVGRPSGWFLGGAGLSLYLAWNLSVATGLILSRFVEIPTDIGLDFVFPLSFVALTVPLLGKQRHWVAAGAAAIATIGAGQFVSSGVTVVAATLVTIAVGVLMEPRDG
jgi:branched chain amino acid efflux pump